MIRFLTPYLVPLFGAMAAALIAAGGWIYLQAQWLDQAEAERDVLKSRIEAINKSRSIDSEVENLDDTAFGDDIDGRLSGDVD